MNEVLLTNVFFMITSGAVVLFTLLLCIGLYYVIKILRAVSRIVERVEEGSETVAHDVARLRAYIAEGTLISQIIGMFVKTTHRNALRHKAKEEADDE